MTLVTNRLEYLKKICLDRYDINTYIIIKKDSIKKIRKDFYVLLEVVKFKNYVLLKEMRSLYLGGVLSYVNGVLSYVFTKNT